MIPLHFAAHTGYGGPSYVISFCCGSMLVTIALWMIRFLFELYRLDGAVGKAYRALPSNTSFYYIGTHFKIMVHCIQQGHL